ncbi:MAG: hypothetical protein QXL51_01320 [Candidatus Aenigmatarchaeota archaeon]
MKAKFFVYLIETILGSIFVLHGNLFITLGIPYINSNLPVMIGYYVLGLYLIVTGIAFLLGFPRWFLNRRLGKKWQEIEI